MARYIDADKLCEALKCMASVQCPDKQNTILGVVSSIENFQTADVVPKSEVEEAVKKVVGATDKVICEAKTEVAREIFELIECAFSPVLVYNGYTVKEYLAELKKKYTEGEAQDG